MTHITLIADGMSCGHCKAAIEKAAGGVAGVAKVLADPATKKVTLDFDENKTGLARIREAIEEAGYETRES